jgi:hypothetical protein
MPQFTLTYQFPSGDAVLETADVPTIDDAVALAYARCSQGGIFEYNDRRFIISPNKVDFAWVEPALEGSAPPVSPRLRERP